MRRVLGALLPVVGWMAVIYTLSTDLGSASHTSRVLEPLLRWVFPSITPEAVELVHALVRKTAHFVVYATLALLILRAWRRLYDFGPGTWSWPAAILAAGASAAYASTDEFHQLFVQSRGASGYDVLIDSAGALGGVIIGYLWWRRRQARRRPVADVAAVS